PLPMENVPAPPYPGPLLGSSGYQTGFTRQPSPYKDHENSGVETSKGLERGE
ncbi:Protein SUR7, partial [Clarias magur]